MTTENRELHPVGAQRSEERSWSWAGRCIYFEMKSGSNSSLNFSAVFLFFVFQIYFCYSSLYRWQRWRLRALWLARARPCASSGWVPPGKKQLSC